MQDRYRADEAKAYLERYAAHGSDLALRIYTCHLIGRDPELVLHGGGNTSVKSTHVDPLGDEVHALYVKGSGWNLGDIEPAGMPGLHLDYLRRLVRLPVLTDEQMVNEQRTHLFDASSPNPSVETLLHAAISAKYVDHSHANAILSLTNHEEGERYVVEALGDGILIVPYVKPGFDLARACAEAIAQHPDCTAMVLMDHGLFTWGETAEESYRRHIDLVDRAERYVAAAGAPREVRPGPDAVAAARVAAARVAPLVRGALGEAGPRWLLEHRVDADLLALVNAERAASWVAAGPLTPDHVLRTKVRAAFVVLDLSADDEALRTTLSSAVATYREAYDAYFDRHAARHGGDPVKLDSTPRVIVIPGVGVFGVGADPAAARICADITEHTFAVKESAAGLGPFRGLSEDRLFEMEYWSLEQAKLGKKTPPPLGRTVALITGGAGAIGLGVARVLHEAGAAVVLADRDEAGLLRAAELLGTSNRVATVHMDVTEADSVRRAFEFTAATFGGVDVVVPNAGIAHSAPLASLAEEDYRRVMEVNAHGVFLTVAEAARQLIRQGTGGHVVLISSKNVFGPGAEFAAYSASKAAAHQLCKVAALELAAHGVAVNMVNPDAVFAEGEVTSGLWAEVGPDRARAKGIDPSELEEHYRRRNLLGARIEGRHVGHAVRFFVSGVTPTTGATLPVDGGVAVAFPR